MRLKNWRRRLSDCIETARMQPFAWGANDCGMFACRCIEAVTGTNPFPGLAGTYGNESGAMAVLAARGASDMEAMAGIVCPTRIAVGRAMAGDLGIVLRGGKKVLTVCTLNGALWAAPGKACLMFHRRSEVTAAFRVD